MSFIVKKKIHGNEYYYLNENKREKSTGKVKTKTLAYLGKNKKDAEKKAKEFIRKPLQQEKKEEIKTEIKKEVKVGKKIDEISSIAGKRGFFFQTANIYGGKAGFFTYGHLGKMLKANWERLWRKNILGLDDNFYEIQSNNILPEPVFKASGHIENFNDPLTECKKCHFRFRADQFLEDNGVENAGEMKIEEMTAKIAEKKLKCPKCGGELSEVKQFNMMFPINVGFNEEKAYLSPETAQAAYLAFKEEFAATRGKLPLGLAIIDKAYRNEISPRQMFFRLREFSQAELQIFFDAEKIEEHEKWNKVKNNKLAIKFHDKSDITWVSCNELNNTHKIPKFYLYYASKVQDFYLKTLKVPAEKFRFRELGEQERAFYNKIHFDVEVFLDTLGGFKEIAGVHYRTDHDLKGHGSVSGKNLEVFYDGKKVLPHVLELSFGVDRNIWMLLDVFYNVGKEGSMFSFPPILSPIKVAVFPIVKGAKFEKTAEKVLDDLRNETELNVLYDKIGSIGRRYARNDEIGTAFCVTIDGDSVKKKDVTVRERNTGRQIRVKIDGLRETLKKLINDEIKFSKAGKPFNF
ncbi:MAG: glycine--tRNA ligase [Candidatus Pacearchaeota archaeon]